MGRSQSWTTPVKCYQCGKDIYMLSQSDWAYKRNISKSKKSPVDIVAFFCSWGCMRKFDKEFGEASKRIYHKGGE